MGRWETMENALKAVDDVAEAWRRDRRELRDEVNWLHSELHGAEMEAKRLRETPPPTTPEPPYDLLIDLLRDEWGIDVSWDGLRRFWYIGLTEKEVQVREQLEAENRRLRSCLEDAAENDRLTTHEFNQLKEERDRLREMLGCPLLDVGKRARQNGKRLPCERLMERNTELRELVRDIWNQARLLDANSHIEGMRLTEQAREEYQRRMEELGVEVEQ